MSSFYFEFNLVHITTGLFLWINPEDDEYEEDMKKKEIWNSSFTLSEKVNIDYDDKKQDIIELNIFTKTEEEIIENKVEIENHKKVKFKLGDETDFINPDIFTPTELQMIFSMIPLEVVTERITYIYNKIYKIKDLKSFIFDKHLYNTIIILNQELQTELKSELAISFAKLVLSKIPQKYITIF